ncbi:maestro heat-like repeat-containing protein family member 7 isoform X1 [Tyto alba]|uniref:maestro heat-like repeat-containing protein family member 7 isoform X1 n=1 Tax=Tyto alba TaxID=56313 RepID=UPI001C67547A|nr:maestro heat-like repeat-containing protein family member 7 isoform X1 [Tyto alba]
MGAEKLEKYSRGKKEVQRTGEERGASQGGHVGCRGGHGLKMLKRQWREENISLGFPVLTASGDPWSEEPPQPGRDSESTWSLSSFDSSDMTTVFGEHLQPSQMTEVLLVAIEALASDDASDRQMGSSVVDMAVRDPAGWLTDVPKVTRSIHRTVERIQSEPARHSLDSLLLLLIKWCSEEVVGSLLKISPACDSAALAMWEVMLSVPWALWNVLMELLNVLQDQKLRKVFSSATEDACIYPLFLLVCPGVDPEEFAALYKAQRYLRHPSPLMLSLVLRVLLTLSESPEMARRMPVLVPDLVETLQDASADVQTKALLFFRNLLVHLKQEEASLIALQLAEKLLPLFDDECSQLRELSISLFREVVKAVAKQGRNKKKMALQVRRVLLPLLLHVADRSESVAQASRDTLASCAEFLGWTRLSSLAETCETRLIGECLLAPDRSRAEEYLRQSLPYLKDSQASLREAAASFLGLAAQRLRNLSQEKRWEICNALLPLAKDPELSVRSVAAHTVSVLTLTEWSPTWRWRLRSLGCWLC